MRRFAGVLIGATVATAAGCAGTSAPAGTSDGRLTACAAHGLLEIGEAGRKAVDRAAG